MQSKLAFGQAGQAVKVAEDDTRLVVPLMVVATIAIFSNMYLTQPVLPIIGAEFGLTPAQAGLTVSSLVLAIAAASVFYGLLSDKIGRKPVMIVSVFLLALPTLLCAFAPNFGLLVVFRVGQGLLIPGYTATAITYLQEEIPPRRLGMVLSYYVCATVAGGFFGRLIGGVLTDVTNNWRVAFVVMGLVDLGLGGLLWRNMPASRNFLPRRKIGSESGTITLPRFNFSAVMVHLRNPQLVSVYIVGFSLMVAFLGLFTYLPYYLESPPFSLSTLMISSVYVVYLVGMGSATMSAKLAGRYGRRTILKVGFSLMIGGALLTLIPVLPMVAIGLITVCLGMFACQATATALVGESVKEGTGRGSAVALYQVFFYVGGSCGGFVPGLLWQGNGWPGVVGCLVVVLVLGLGSIFWSERAHS